MKCATVSLGDVVQVVLTPENEEEKRVAKFIRDNAAKAAVSSTNGFPQMSQGGYIRFYQHASYGCYVNDRDEDECSVMVTVNTRPES